MSQDQSSNEAQPLACELDVTAPATVAPGLGYPNNRVEASPTKTGWQASVVLENGLADQSNATVTSVDTANNGVER